MNEALPSEQESVEGMTAQEIVDRVRYFIDFRDTDPDVYDLYPEGAHALNKLQQFVNECDGVELASEFWRKPQVAEALDSLKREVEMRRMEGLEELNQGVQSLGGLAVTLKDGSCAVLTGFGMGDSGKVYPCLDSQLSSFDDIDKLNEEHADEPA